MNTIKKFCIVLATALIGVPMIVSCEEDDQPNYGSPRMNKNTFIFGQDGGVDTLYSIINSNYEVFDVEVRDTINYNTLYSAYFNGVDTALYNEDKENVGKITYKDGQLYTLETVWYSLRFDETAKDRRYIIEAHPSKDGYEMRLGINIKHGGTSVLLKRE